MLGLRTRCTSIDPALAHAYQSADYRYHYRGHWYTLALGSALRSLILPPITHSFCFITAMNPHSRPLNYRRNQQRAARLVSALTRQHQTLLPACAQDTSGHWPREDGVLWLNPQPLSVLALMRYWQQNAVLANWGGGSHLYYLH